MRRVLLLLVLLGLVAAFVGGWWPEHQGRVAAEQQLEQVREALAAAQARLRLYGLQDRLLTLSALVEQSDFGGAQAMSSTFFDAVRAEAVRSPELPALAGILAKRDEVTAALARHDASVKTALDAIRDLLEKTYSPPVPAPPSPSSMVPAP